MTFSNTDLERDYKKAYERTDNQEINTKNLGNHKIIIKASDGHGNVTYKEIDMESCKRTYSKRLNIDKHNEFKD